MIKLAIFDFDGTLVNTLEGIRYSGNLVLEEYDLTPLSSEFYRKAIGHGAAALVELVLIKKNLDLSLKEEFLNKFLKTYSENWMVGIYTYDGILKLISSLNKMGIKIAVNTNKPQNIAVKGTKEFLNSNIIKVIKGACDDYAKKPSPQGVNLILEEFNILNKESIYIGDSIVDIETSKNAGIKSIGVTWGFGELNQVEKADYLVDNAKEIENIISSIE